jgi:ribosomal-protein-alanine N-acetyltransferase
MMANDQTAFSHHIRPASNTDLPRIMEIERLSFAEQWDRRQFETALKDLVFLYEDREIWGFLVACSCNLARRAVIMRLAVHPAARGQGIASQLLRAAINAYTKLNLRCVELDATIYRDGPIRLYEKVGFKNLKLVPLNHNKNDKSYPIMQLLLPSG